MSDEFEDPRENELKMWAVVRRDLKMPAGKLLIQGGHAFMAGYRQIMRSDPILADRYFEQSQPKISVGVKNEGALLRALKECQEAGLNCYLVTDEGRTVFGKPTNTIVAVGPCLRRDLPPFVRKLNQFRDPAPAYEIEVTGVEDNDGPPLTLE